MIERDYMGPEFFQTNRYTLYTDDKPIELNNKHFQPIFFAASEAELKDNPAAYNALKKYREFVRAPDMLDRLKKKW